MLAPTGTIGFRWTATPPASRPDFSLVKFKKLVGGGSMQIVNQTIPRALRKVGYAEETVEAIVSTSPSTVTSSTLRDSRPSTTRSSTLRWASVPSPMGHVRMMAAVQPFLSGAISKTVNMPETATIEEVEICFQGWKTGLKALAICTGTTARWVSRCPTARRRRRLRPPRRGRGAEADHRPVRKRLPKKRRAKPSPFTVGGAEGYLTAGSYPDDGLGEVFLKLGKQGSTLAGVMDAFSIAISIALQYGVPLEAFTSKFVNMRFEPAGLTDDPDVRMAQSIMDYIFRRLALDYLPYDTRAALSIFTAEERAATLAGYDAAPATATSVSDDVAEGDLEDWRSRLPSSTTARARGGDLRRGWLGRPCGWFHRGRPDGIDCGERGQRRRAPGAPRRRSCWRRSPARHPMPRCA